MREAYESFIVHYGFEECGITFASFERYYYRIAQEFLEWKKSDGKTEQV